MSKWRLIRPLSSCLFAAIILYLHQAHTSPNTPTNRPVVLQGLGVICSLIGSIKGLLIIYFAPGGVRPSVAFSRISVWLVEGRRRPTAKHHFLPEHLDSPGEAKAVFSYGYISFNRFFSVVGQISFDYKTASAHFSNLGSPLEKCWASMAGQRCRSLLDHNFLICLHFLFQICLKCHHISMNLMVTNVFFKDRFVLYKCKMNLHIND